MSQEQPTPSDHLRAAARIADEAIKTAYGPQTAAEVCAMHGVHLNAVNDALVDAAGEIGKLKHVIQRQQEELANPTVKPKRQAKGS